MMRVRTLVMKFTTTPHSFIHSSEYVNSDRDGYTMTPGVHFGPYTIFLWDLHTWPRSWNFSFSIREEKIHGNISQQMFYYLEGEWQRFAELLHSMGINFHINLQGQEDIITVNKDLISHIDKPKSSDIL